MEHPQIERTLKTGYPETIQDEHWGVDYFGNEILEGDEVIVGPDGEIILADSLEDYLIEVLGFEFKTACSEDEN